MTFTLEFDICPLTVECFLLSFVFRLLTFVFRLLTSDFWIDLLISYSLLYFECAVTGTDGNCTCTDDTGRMVLALILKVLTALALMLMTLVQSFIIFTDRF